jgi:uncharacterized protein YpmS
MDKIVIIVFLLVALVAWIAWLVYNYAIFNKQVAIEAKVSYWKARVNRVKDCLNDLVNSINKQFPKSNLQYFHTDDSDEVTGQIKY